MMVPIRKLFGLSTEKQSGQMPALTGGHDPEMKNLRETFKDAVYGNRFRTLSYISSFDDPATADREWLEAFKMPGQGWKIKSMLSHGGDVTGEPVVRQKVLDGTYSFFGAVEKLAVYAATQGDMNKEACESPDAEELGYLYFRNFAEREGVAFDLEGRPHPTSQGMIVSDGIFPPEAYDKAEDSYKHAKEIHAVPVQDFAKALLPDVQTDDTAKLQSAKEISKAMGVLTQKIMEANEIENNMMFFYDFAAMVKTGKISSGYADRYKASKVILFDSAELYAGNETLASLIHTPVNLYGFYLCAYMAAAGRRANEENVANIEALAVKKLSAAGVAEEDAKIITEKAIVSNLRYFEKESGGSQAFRPLHVLTKYFTDTRDYYEQMQGINVMDRVEALPSQEKLVQKLKM